MMFFVFSCVYWVQHHLLNYLDTFIKSQSLYTCNSIYRLWKEPPSASLNCSFCLFISARPQGSAWGRPPCSRPRHASRQEAGLGAFVRLQGQSGAAFCPCVKAVVWYVLFCFLVFHSGRTSSMLLLAGSKSLSSPLSFSVCGLRVSAGLLRLLSALVPCCSVMSCVPLPSVHLLWKSPSVLCYIVRFSCYLCVSLKASSILNTTCDGCN